MLYSEFLELSGLTENQVTVETYANVIEPMYQALPNLSKQQFVKLINVFELKQSFPNIERTLYKMRDVCTSCAREYSATKLRSSVISYRTELENLGVELSQLELHGDLVGLEHGAGLGTDLRPADQREEQILSLFFIIALQQFLADPAVLGCLRQQFFIIVRYSHFFRQQFCHIASPGPILTPDGDDRLILHTKNLPFITWSGRYQRLFSFHVFISSFASLFPASRQKAFPLPFPFFRAILPLSFPYTFT